MRTTNMLELQNKEIKRRTRVATLFPNEASLLRLVTAVLVELSEDWETGMRYLIEIELRDFSKAEFDMGFEHFQV